MKYFIVNKTRINKRTVKYFSIAFC